MKCPKCDSTQLLQLPANQITRRPGYKCTNCSAHLRAPGTFILYFAVIILGIGLFSLFIFAYIEDKKNELPLRGFWICGLALFCAGYGLFQLSRPTPKMPGKDTQTGGEPNESQQEN